MNSAIRWPAVWLILNCANVGHGAPADNPAVATVGELHAGIIAIDADHAPDAYAERAAAYAPLIRATHDLPFMARVTMSRTWQRLDDAQREAFVARFEELSIANYAAQFRELGGSVFETLDLRETAGGRIEVRSRLIPDNGEPVTLNYVLAPDDSGYRIINVLADGVSELALKRSQYQRVIEREGFDALMEKIGVRIRELAREAESLNAS